MDSGFFFSLHLVSKLLKPPSSAAAVAELCDLFPNNTNKSNTQNTLKVLLTFTALIR